MRAFRSLLACRGTRFGAVLGALSALALLGHLLTCFGDVDDHLSLGPGNPPAIALKHASATAPAVGADGAQLVASSRAAAGFDLWLAAAFREEARCASGGDSPGETLHVHNTALAHRACVVLLR